MFTWMGICVIHAAERGEWWDVKVKLSLSEGTAKIVHVDQDGYVTTIIECTPDNCTEEYVVKTVSLKRDLTE